MRRYLSLAALLGVVLASRALPAAAQDGEFGTALKGRVVFGGEKAPEQDKLNVTKDQAHCLMNGPILSEEWVVNDKNKGVKGVFIWLEPAAGAKLPVHPKLADAPKEAAKIDQPCCAFVPHTVALRQGQSLVAKNSSPIQHNFRYAGHPLFNPGANRLMPPQSEFEISNLKADRFPVLVSCDIHPWMKAWVRVFNHPYYAVTDEDGAFSIELPPVGQYTMKVWHPASGWMGGEKGKDGTPVQIKGDTTDLGDLEITQNK